MTPRVAREPRGVQCGRLSEGRRRVAVVNRDELLAALEAEAEAAQTPADKWAVIEKAWVLYCQHGAGTFDWDYDSRDVMETLTGHFAFEGLPAPR